MELFRIARERGLDYWKLRDFALENNTRFESSGRMYLHLVEKDEWPSEHVESLCRAFQEARIKPRESRPIQHEEGDPPPVEMYLVPDAAAVRRAEVAEAKEREAKRLLAQQLAKQREEEARNRELTRALEEKRQKERKQRELEEAKTKVEKAQEELARLAPPPIQSLRWSRKFNLER